MSGEKRGVERATPSRDDITAFFRIMTDHVKSLHDRLDESVHRVKDVPTDELQEFVDKERRLLEAWSRERLEEFSALHTVHESGS